MSEMQWSESLQDTDKRDQLKLVYDYIKFHIGLYLATPTAIALLADVFKVKQDPWFGALLAAAILVFLVAGAHAGYFMSRHINDPWQSGYLERFELEAFSARRRFMHHGLYWLGLLLGLSGLVSALVHSYCFGHPAVAQSQLCSQMSANAYQVNSSPPRRMPGHPDLARSIPTNKIDMDFPFPRELMRFATPSWHFVAWRLLDFSGHKLQLGGCVQKRPAANSPGWNASVVGCRTGCSQPGPH